MKELSKEREAEMRAWITETMPMIAQLSDESEHARMVLTSAQSFILECLDALTAERERADRAVSVAKNAMHNLRDLSFECFAVDRTQAPSRECYARTFNALESGESSLKELEK